MTTTCPACSLPIQFAPSKRVHVCKNCLSIAKTGKSIKEIAREKSKASLEKSRLKSQERQAKKPKTAYKIPKFSAKGAKQAREVAATKKKVKAEAADGQSFVACAGCGKFFSGLDGSHKVQLSKSSELASEERNIRLLCRGCHDAWGEGSVTEMIALRCFVPDLRYLFEHDLQRFYRILDRLLAEYNVNPTPKLERVLGKIEKFETQTEQ